MARLLARSRAIHRLVRRLAWTDGALEILEEGRNSAACHQMRWARGLEQGSAYACFPSPPRDQLPENFSEHWRHCRCCYWQWFLAQGIESEIKTVLDVGCSLGYVAEHFLRQGFDVTGVTSNLHEMAVCLRRGVKVLDEDFHFLSVPDERFDLILSSHSLEHSISPLFALWEWKRVVRPGGYLMIATPVAIEQDARAAYPKCYDSTRDTMSFSVADEGTFTSEEAGTAASAYGAGLHTFVLSYWQLRGLFDLTGLERIADVAADQMTFELLGVEYVDGRIPCDPRRPMTALFLLRKPYQTNRKTALPSEQALE